MKGERYVLIGIYILLFEVVYGQDTFDARAQAIIDEYAITTVPGDIPKYGFWYAQANFAKGRDIDGESVLNQTLASTPADPSFAYWSCMDAYLRWRDSKYTSSLIGSTRTFMTSFTGYGEGTSQNHQIMLAAARYLASEIWNLPSGTEFSPDDPTGKQHLLTKMNEWVHNGMIEHDSPIYIMFHLGPMRTLADFAEDPEIKQKARLAFEWILINAANEWMDGHMPSSSLRNLFPYDAQNEYYETDFAQWLYFGGTTAADLNIGSLPRACFSIGLALSDYQLPEIIIDIAKKKDQVILNRESHAIGDEWQLDFHKTSLLDHDFYALYSQVELPSGQNGGLNEQSHRWGMVWKSVNSPNEKSAFWIKHGRRDISKNKAGTTKYEQVLQNGRTLVAVYDIPADDSFPFAEGFVSADLSAADDSPNNVYFHYGNVLVAILSPKEMTWNEGDERIRLDHLKNGVVIETANPDRYSGNTTEQLAAFKAEIESIDRLAGSDVDDTFPEIIYQSIYEYTLDLKYQTSRKIDGVDVDYTTWPLMENPWVNQKQFGDTLYLTFEDTTRTYDFKNWRVLEEPEIELPTSVEKNTAENIKVYPNPVRSKLIVQRVSAILDSVEMTITDSSGRTIYKTTTSWSKSGKIEVSIKGWKQGVYWLGLLSGGQSINRKFIVK